MSMKVEGLDKVMDLVERLPRQNQRRIKINAAAKGARVFSNQIKQNIRNLPQTTIKASGRERWAKSISVKRTIRTETHSFVEIGPRYRGGKNTFPEAHLFERGTTRRTKSSGASTGQIKPTGVMRKAYDSRRMEAVQKSSEALLEGTMKEAEKLLK